MIKSVPVSTTAKLKVRQRLLKSVLVHRIFVLVCAVAVWDAMSGGLGLGWRPFPPALFPSPGATLESLVAYARSNLLLQDALQTLSQAFIGLILGIVVGVSFGLVLAYVRVVGDALEPLLVGFNSLPRVAVAPLLIIWFGLGLTSKVLLAFFTVVFIVFFNTYLGVRNIDPDLVRAIRVMGGSTRDVARMVILPSVAAWVFAALRTCVGFALAASVTGEFVGSTQGLGYRMVIASGVLNTPRVFAILLTLGAVGYVLVEIARRVEAYFLRWRPSAMSEG